MRNGYLFEGFLIHKNIFASFLIKVLILAPFHTYVFQLLADVETPFDDVAFHDVFQRCTHDRIAFSGLYVQEVDTKIEFSVEADTRSFFNVL